MTEVGDLFLMQTLLPANLCKYVFTWSFNNNDDDDDDDDKQEEGLLKER